MINKDKTKKYEKLNKLFNLNEIKIKTNQIFSFY